LREVGAILGYVRDLDRELDSVTRTAAFLNELFSISDASGREQEALLGLSDVSCGWAISAG